MTQELLVLLPLDGRYKRETHQLAKYFSEFAFIRYKLLIEVEYFISILEFLNKKRLSKSDKDTLRKIYKDFSLKDAKQVKEIEAETRHDTKSVEYFLKERAQKTKLKELAEFIHFGLTSNDVIDNAYSLMLRDALRDVLLPPLRKLSKKLVAWQGNTEVQPCSQEPTASQLIQQPSVKSLQTSGPGLTTEFGDLPHLSFLES